MYRPTTPPNHYGQGTPYSAGNNMPRPRFQSSPRYYPQFGSPQHSPFPGAGHCGRGDSGPRGLRSPRPDFTSPPHYNQNRSSPYLDRSNNGNNSFGNLSFGSSNRGSTPRNNRGRGRFPSSGHKDSPHQRQSVSDCNPGGSDDIRQYYNPKMVQDPWAHLQASSFPNSGSHSS